jgi:hypothetical protein
MNLEPLPFRSGLEEYENQSRQLLDAHRAGDAAAIRLIHQNHPSFLDPKIPWLPKRLPESEIRSAALDIGDVHLTIARWYDFQNWSTLTEYAEAVQQECSPACRFESAVEAVIMGDIDALGSLLRDDPELIRARSTRVTKFDPPVHRATLLHYIAANGVENYRQKTPKNAVEIARTLLQAGAAPDALADMYGGQYATMPMLVSSSHPAQAGVQVPLIDILVDFGASAEALGSRKWGSPLMTALAFGFPAAAEALVRRGAKVDNIAAAAGLGRIEDVHRMLAASGPESRHRALALSAQHGHADIVRCLLDAGEDPDRCNPEGNHAHSTPLHQAALAGHATVVRLLVERGARLDIADTIYGGTPLSWAIHAGKSDIEQYLRAQGAKTAE